MRKICHYSSIFVLIITLLSAQAYAQTENDWKLSNYLKIIIAEYGYYANIYDDGSYFPQARQQEILQHIEENFLKNHAVEIMTGEADALYSSSTVVMARLFLLYGDTPLEYSSFVVPIMGVARQKPRLTRVNPHLMHETVMKIAEKYVNSYSTQWGHSLPSNNAIDLIKLYVGLGADIHTVLSADSEYETDPLRKSLYYYHPIKDHRTESWEEKYDLYVEPDKKHRADDIKAPDKDEEGYEEVHYYRSPVTYWLEEFIEKDYPASMLDTHKLHYPRFMKEASVAEVMDMLKNSYGYKIPVNINCPYQRKQGAGDEVAQAVSPAELCPLIPSINMRDAMGRTPLHIAGEQGNKAVYDALIQIGADESIKDYRGNLPKI